MATLTGYAVLMVNFPWQDHTYVLSDDGFTWPCRGSFSGGMSICYGQGNSSLADCLSQPNSEAGISYGVTGVCHQMANRILYPARALVNPARGYFFSVALYTTYGLGPWPELQRCISIHPSGVGGATRDRDIGGSGGRSMSGKDFEFLRRIRAIYDGIASRWVPRNEGQIQRAELDAMCDVFLGADYSFQKKNEISAVQAETGRERELLATQLEAKRLSPEDYLGAMTRLLERTARRYEQILGPNDFRRLFGLPPEQASTILDPETFLRSHPS